MKELLTLSFTFSGLTAPWFSWVTAIILIVWPAREILRLIVITQRQKRKIKTIILDIKKLINEYPRQGSKGLRSVAIDKLNELFIKAPYLISSWNIFRSKLIYRPSPDLDDEEQVWATESACNVFSEDSFLGEGFNKSFFHSIPGIVTGIGLLMTFFAILVGLLDVRIVENKVHGLQSLIGGLSGKFISSVAALLAATVFLFFEKSIFHNVNRARLTLTRAIDILIPLRSESHLLEEICLNISEQTNAFRLFNSDLSQKIRNSFSESMGPTLERMVTAIDNQNKLSESLKVELLGAIHEMNNLLLRAEQSRQDSISGQVESLLKDIQRSLSESITRMSTEFSRSLTGSTQDQFIKVSETVGATAEVLAEMNKQFTSTQTSLQELIELAKNSTENQLNNGSAIIERMVNVLGGSMLQMEDKINDLSMKMTNTIEGTAERSAEAAGSIISEVKMLNEKTVQQFIDILQKHEQQLDRVDLLKKTLQDAVQEFGEYVTGYNQINSDLKTVSKDANVALQILSQSSQKLMDNQDSFNRVAQLVNTKIDQLASSNEKQQELWGEINESMEKYKNTFTKVESSASNLLSQISSHLQAFSKATQEHFKETITVANDHVNIAVSKLANSIEELSNELDDLGEIVADIDKIYNRIRR